MKVFLILVVLLLVARPVPEQKDATAEQITQALGPLPEPLRAEATVVLDAMPGKRVVLRKGSNNLLCRADTPAPGFNVYCYQKDMDAFWTRFEQLTLEGKSNAEIRDTLGAEALAGKLKLFTGVAVYTLSGDSPESSLPQMSVFVPNATSESTGLSNERSHYHPWLMWAGTPFAHVMIPGH